MPRAIGTALLLAVIGGGLGWTAWSLSDDAAALVESLPAASQKVREAWRAQRGLSESAIDKMQRAAVQIEQAAQEGTAAKASQRGVQRVSIERSRFDIKDCLWAGTLRVAASIGQAVVVVFIAYFLMLSGNRFRRKMVRIAGPAFTQKRVTVEVLDEISAQIHRYLLMQLFTSALLGVGVGLAFAAVSLEHAAVWGVVAGVLNFVPYLGTLVLTAASTLVAFVQFGTLDGALLIAGIAMGLHILSGKHERRGGVRRRARLRLAVGPLGSAAGRAGAGGGESRLRPRGRLQGGRRIAGRLIVEPTSRVRLARSTGPKLDPGRAPVSRAVRPVR